MTARPLNEVLRGIIIDALQDAVLMTDFPKALDGIVAEYLETCYCSLHFRDEPYVTITVGDGAIEFHTTISLGPETDDPHFDPNGIDQRIQCIDEFIEELTKAKDTLIEAQGDD